MAAQSPLPPLRRRRHHHVTHALRLGALTLALLAGPAAGQAAAAPGVVLHGPNGTHTFSAADLSDWDVVDTEYVLRAPGHEVTQPFSGVSVGALLARAGFAPGNGFLHLVRGDGTWTTLSAADVGDPSPFAGGLKPIVVVSDPTTRYIRPERNASDDNAGDDVTSDTHEPLDIFLQSGAPLQVSATATPADPSTGDDVTVRASVRGARAGETVTVTWQFGDGRTAGGDTARHRYGSEGIYAVQAIAHGSRDSGGASAPVRVTVGKPVSQGPGTGGGTQTTGPGTGPSRGPSTGTGSGPTRRPGNTNTGDDSSVQPRRATPQATPAGTPLPPPAPAATISPSPAATPPSGAHGGTPPGARRSRPAPRKPGGELVRGVLVSATAPLPLPSSAAAAARAGARAAAQAGRAAGSLPLGGLAALLLLGGGAWRESSGRRRKAER